MHHLYFMHLPPCTYACCPLQGHLHKALESLLNLEKSSRLAEDVTATKAACAAILEVAFEAKEWKLLEENILLLAKRRSQLKQVGEKRGKIRVCPSVSHIFPCLRSACVCLGSICRTAASWFRCRGARHSARLCLLVPLSTNVPQNRPSQNHIISVYALLKTDLHKLSEPIVKVEVQEIHEAYCSTDRLH